MAAGMVRGRPAGYKNVDKSDVLQKIKIHEGSLGHNIVDFRRDPKATPRAVSSALAGGHARNISFL